MTVPVKVTIREGEEGAKAAGIVGDLVVIIDVLRMSSTITAALDNSSESVTTVREIEDAQAIRKKEPSFILGGERNNKKIDSFDLGNSPREYTQEKVSGRNIVITTSNGTRVIDTLLRTNPETRILIGCALNAKAVCNVIRKIISKEQTNITLLAVGKIGSPSPEDHIIAHILRQYLNNEPVSITSKILERSFIKSPHGMELKRSKLKKDIEFCSWFNISKIVPTNEKQKFENANTFSEYKKKN
ncbi:MAG: 2-phosphosulfolactate phosphatase [Candidatus Ranarchaeia archaeon]